VPNGHAHSEGTLHLPGGNHDRSASDCCADPDPVRIGAVTARQ
jgi:hypothetical protein